MVQTPILTQLFEGQGLVCGGLQNWVWGLFKVRSVPGNAGSGDEFQIQRRLTPACGTKENRAKKMDKDRIPPGSWRLGKSSVDQKPTEAGSLSQRLGVDLPLDFC